ncbi:MAG: response regulator transcription factor [Candidatus Eisenbacteria bacterium]|uniref:Response regulator transcription factor n=1 Tax=Eiseniibacteriota bacterium TaxID=2212470 RepID=A0A956NHE5_UNCEI|nr:response regulator transcription factor [Candidatus Eisenbacteria bacterium]MCB9465349.1 response regulator transcription factor [Candidatus Eisenbacteria bacterium]
MWQLVAAQRIVQMTEAATNLETRTGRVLTVFLATVSILGLIDLLTDTPGDRRGLHLTVEVALIAVSLGATLFLARGWSDSERSLTEARSSSDRLRLERDAWRSRAETTLRGLGEAIDEQLSSWGLTPTERETAVFLLKGYSHKEIARLTKRSERTVRQHSVAVYRKSGLAGRSELAAFFLEDLLPPAGEESGGK